MFKQTITSAPAPRASAPPLCSNHGFVSHLPPLVTAGASLYHGLSGPPLSSSAPRLYSPPLSPHPPSSALCHAPPRRRAFEVPRREAPRQFKQNILKMRRVLLKTTWGGLIHGHDPKKPSCMSNELLLRNAYSNWVSKRGHLRQVCHGNMSMHCYDFWCCN